MNIFKFTDYSAYLKDYIHHLPKKGRGEISKMASAIGIHTTLMSLILSSSRDLSAEQTFDLGQYLNLTNFEQDYFSTMVQYRRAGHARLKIHLKEKLAAMKEQASKAARQIDHEKKLTDQHQMQFYSSWIYSAIRLFCTTESDGKTIEQIGERFLLSRQAVVHHVQFLLEAGLLIVEKNKYKMGVSRTYLERDSIHLSKHHTNWRLQSIQRIENLSDDELMLTAPISISKEDFILVREEISALIKSVTERVKKSPAEQVACLNIDLFYVVPGKKS